MGSFISDYLGITRRSPQFKTPESKLVRLELSRVQRALLNVRATLAYSSELNSLLERLPLSEAEPLAFAWAHSYFQSRHKVLIGYANHLLSRSVQMVA